MTTPPQFPPCRYLRVDLQPEPVCTLGPKFIAVCPTTCRQCEAQDEFQTDQPE